MEFERKVVARFEKNGWWVHFMAPDSRGAQPFDIIAMKDGNLPLVPFVTLGMEPGVRLRALAGLRRDGTAGNRGI